MSVMRLAFVKEYTDRTGKMRRYFRKRGCKTIALPGAPGSPEFVLAYQSTMGGTSTQPVATATPSAGTVAALIIDYQRSPRRRRKRTGRYFISSATSTGHRLVADMPRDKASAYI
jgi:hypothetical protein